MLVIRARNVHEALPRGIYELGGSGITAMSRAGEVIVHPMPVTTVYSHPTERVLFHPERDANPFFHLMEGLWMLAGHDDVAFVAKYAKRMKTFSDDGATLHGAYGARWRRWRYNDADIDQLPILIDYLKAHPKGRRGVLQMWNPGEDLEDDESLCKDVPCNTAAFFWIAAGRLNMTVTCRSNDIIWGCYGANAVHFSMLQEYVAANVGAEVGYYWQVSNNFHAYRAVFDPLKPLYKKFGAPSPYEIKPGSIMGVKPFAMVDDPKTWDRDLALFFEDPGSHGFDNQFFSRVAKPMFWAHEAYSRKSDIDRFDKAREILGECLASDWALAAFEWIDRREGAARG